MSVRYNTMEKFVPTGFLESFILSILKEEPVHGYKLVEKIKEKTGFWKPSSGTIYPTLHSLLERGFIKEIREGRRKKYKLTRKGLKISREAKMIERELKNKLLEILNKTTTSRVFPCLSETLKLVSEILDKSEKEQKAIKIINNANLKLKKLVDKIPIQNYKIKLKNEKSNE